MLINELSKKTGITAHTIRYYKKYGLIKGVHKVNVKSNNYFHFDEESIQKLELIKDAKAIGFTLNEIKQLLEAWYNKRYSNHKRLLILDEKLQSVETKIKQLKEMKKMIGTLKKVMNMNDC
ncbi:MAG: MerR family transcriptional regulator [Bacteroidia bacterium]|nr:MerR family transcriptional regulator [Bacteroidia bacterium]